MEDQVHRDMLKQATLADEMTRRKYTRRGRCQVCGFSQRVVSSGMIGFHRVYSGNEGRVCRGSGLEPMSDKS